MAHKNEHADRIAVLVICGMGEQTPYQTLNNLARGLAGALRNAVPSGTNTPSYDIQLNSINRGNIPQLNR